MKCIIKLLREVGSVVSTDRKGIGRSNEII